MKLWFGHPPRVVPVSSSLTAATIEGEVGKKKLPFAAGNMAISTVWGRFRAKPMLIIAATVAAWLYIMADKANKIREKVQGCAMTTGERALTNCNRFAVTKQFPNHATPMASRSEQ
jgi:hypothetical protein